MTGTGSGAAVTAEELRRRAAALAPVLRERARRAEELRQLPAETVADLGAAGLLRIDTPTRYGGYDNEIEHDASLDVSFELARACASTAWCQAQWSIHTWMVGNFPIEGQEEFFSTGPDTLASSAVVPNLSKTESASGGLKISGRWEFSSGSDLSAWALLGVPGPEGRLYALVPRLQYEIVDNWFVSGLRGTGSKDIVIDEAFVPESRLLDPELAGEQNFTGWQLHGRLTYRIPHAVMTGWGIIGPLIGIGQGAVDEFTDRLRGTSGRGRSADSIALQLRLAESSAEVDAARLLCRSDVRAIFDKGSRGETFPLLERARYNRDKAFSARLAVRAVNRLFDASGGHALFDSEPMQRFHRDVHAGSHQARADWDVAAQAYSLLALGAG